SGGGLLREGPAEGPDAERLHRPGGGRAATAVVRGALQPGAPAVRLGVHHGQVARVPPQPGRDKRPGTWDVSLTRTTKRPPASACHPDRALVPTVGNAVIVRSSK